MAGNSIDLVVGSHHGTHMGILDRGYKGREIYFPKLSFRQIHRCGIQTSEGFSARDQMLGASDDMTLVKIPVPTLETPDGIFPHLGHKERILSEGLSHPSPTSVSSHVKIRGESPVKTLLTHFLGGFGPDLLDYFRVK